MPKVPPLSPRSLPPARPLVIPRPRRGGFALLITITLLAFLVLLLVSLSSLTRVETQVATNSQAATQARQNALLALNIALGQIQKYTGPDQRVTARADILDTNPLALNSSGTSPNTNPPAIGANGYPTITGVPNPYWVGVWDSSAWNELTGVYTGYGVSGIRGKQRPTPMVWLVSGNENSGTQSVPTTAITGSEQMLAAGVNADGTPNTIAPAVVVPQVAIQSAAVPGLSGTQTIGHYAWWVGDDGVKANVALVPSVAIAAAVASSAPAPADYYWKAMTPTRSAGELMQVPVAAPTGNTTGTASFPEYSDIFAQTAAGQTLQQELGGIINEGQLPLLEEGSASASILPEAGLRQHEFDLTTRSAGVIADTERGGLRLDLTRYLETGNTDSAFTGNNSIYPTAAAIYNGTSAAPIYNTAALTAAGVTGDRQPSFALLRSWYQIGQGLNGMNPTASMQPDLEPSGSNTITQMGLFPVITRFDLMYSAMSAGPGQSFQMLLHPSVTLWNPNNVTLSPQDMVLQVGSNNLNVTAAVQDSTSGVYYLGNTTVHDATGTITMPLRFHMQGVSLAPGETVVYTLDAPSSGSTWSPPGPGNTNPLSFPLMVPHWNSSYYYAVPIAGLTLASTPLPAGDTLSFILFTQTTASAGVSSYQFPAELYRTTDYPYTSSGLDTPLQNLTDPTWQAVGSGMDPTTPLAGNATLAAASSGDLGPLPLPSAPPSDNSVFVGELAAMDLPDTFDDSIQNGVIAANAEAVPFAEFNPRGAYGGLTAFEGARGSVDGDPFFRWSRISGGGGGMPTPSIVPQSAPSPDLAYAGASASGLATLGNYYVMFDYPRPATASDSGDPVVTSLGEFQHVDMSSFSLQPSYVFGNSWPDPRILRQDIAGIVPNTLIPDYGFDATQRAENGTTNNQYLRDVSYLANHALWDRFFLSTIPQITNTTSGNLDATAVLPNTRMTPVAGMVPGETGYPPLSEVRNVNNAAASLLLNGAFNINSTSVDAWRAFLGGLANVPVPDAGFWQPPDPTGTIISQTGTTTDPTGAGLLYNYSRFLLPLSYTFNQTDSAFSATTSKAVQSAGAWVGHRYLTATDIDTLARNMVEEVKVRGPFMSLADFVNRRLITDAADGATATTNSIVTHLLEVGANGAISRAILNLTDITKGLNAALNVPIMSSASGFTYTGESEPAPVLGSTGAGWRGLPAEPGQFELMNGGVAAQLSNGAPGFLTQADVLQKIGGAISARSDTFTIRAYGDYCNPVTGAVEGKAWCEAVVQRYPQYVDSSQPPWTGESADNETTTALNATNLAFGRRYKIVSFRWLTPSDL